MLPPIMRIRGDLGSRRVSALATAESGELRSLFDATVQRGESNSVLVLGPRGVGKTDMVSEGNGHSMYLAALLRSAMFR